MHLSTYDVLCSCRNFPTPEGDYVSGSCIIQHTSQWKKNTHTHTHGSSKNPAPDAEIHVRGGSRRNAATTSRGVQGPQCICLLLFGVVISCPGSDFWFLEAKASQLGVRTHNTSEKTHTPGLKTKFQVKKPTF